MKVLVEKLEREKELTKTEWKDLLGGWNEELAEEVFQRARAVREKYYGKKVFLRGLIEFTNYCKNDCYYCGIRAGNGHVKRYRLMPEEILECCEQGRNLGFRTFVLQGGEDPYFTDDLLADLIFRIKKKFPECAITLSIGEKKRESYQAFFDAGAERYLLRHETAVKSHYEKLHPKKMSFENRMRCLSDLKEIGFQTGCGFMVGSPGQTIEELAEEFLFIKKLNPEMVGIGPFVPHHDTPFAKEQGGTLEQTIFLLGLFRLMLPEVLLPATTALGTIHPKGREMGILAGANVVMPNLSPVRYRKQYELYDNKICTGEESAECKGCLEHRIRETGYEIVESRGDPIHFQNAYPMVTDQP